MKKHSILIISITLIVLAAATSIALFDHTHHDENARFNAKETIFDHLVDHYSWEVPFSHSHHIPLPIIVQDYEGGWHCFMSSRLSHGEMHEGFRIGTEEDGFDGKVVGTKPNGEVYRPLDISITKNVAALLITVIVVCLCLFPLVRWYKNNGTKSPRGIVGAIEMLTCMIYDNVIKSILGPVKGARFAPYLLTAFYFIFISNLMGLMVIFPAGANLTGNLAITMVLAICTFLAVNIFGTKEYWKEIFWPDVPMFLKCPLPIMPFIEIFGVFTKPIDADDTSLCQHDGWSHDSTCIVIAHFHLQGDGRRSSSRWYNGIVSRILTIYVHNRYIGKLHPSLCIYHVVDDIHIAGTG